MKKGMYYSMDALLAGLLIVGVAVTLLSLSYYEPSMDDKTFITQDLLNVLSAITVGEINHPFVVNETLNGNITDINNTVLEQIGEYWALNETAKANFLFEIVVNDSMPPHLNVLFSIEGDELFLQNSSDINNLVISRRMISGIAKGAPITGSSSSANLKKVRNKKTNAYAYFGGFYGQGNVSVQLQFPTDFQVSRLLASELKIETPGTFDLYINDIACGGSRTGSTGEISLWNVMACNGSFQAGENDIKLVFTTQLNVSYVSGGFLRVVYTTDTVQDPAVVGYKRYYLPEISGFINMYDAFSAQGLIRNWTMNLTLYNEYDTFVTVANETIFIAPGQNTTQNLIYSRVNQTLPPTEIPLRIGTTNLSNITIATAGKPSDSFLVTDVSGSMSDCGRYYTQDVEYCSYEYFWWIWWIGRECPLTTTCVSNECGGTSTTQNHLIYNKTVSTCNATLLDIAKEADHLFVDIILNDSSLHEIGLVDFSTSANTPTGLTNVQGVLDAEIDTYVDGGWTCTCCGINQARDLINVSTDNKFIVVLSDGEPTAYCGGGIHDYTGSTGDNTRSQNDAIAAAQQACADNITVYAIGFGESMSATGHSVMQQIACNSSLYYNATNVSALAQIYENISNQILVAANYSSQTLSIVGNYSVAHLYNGSYVDLYFEPLVLTSNQGKISLTFESDQFGGCSATVPIPGGIDILDAYVTSFSSKHWTKLVTANGVVVFNLSDYGSDYILLGDPFLIQIPTTTLIPGANNSIVLQVGDSPTNDSVCSLNNTLIYTILINASTPRSETFEIADGCNWTIESETDLTSQLLIPIDYTGSNQCNYTSTSVVYNAYDAYDSATYHLLVQLDPDNNGKVLVDLTEADLEITITLVSGVPYLWGPTTVSMRAWT